MKEVIKLSLKAILMIYLTTVVFCVLIGIDRADSYSCKREKRIRIFKILKLDLPFNFGCYLGERV